MCPNIINSRDFFPYLQNCPSDAIYFDNAATTQKPISVIKKTYDFYAKKNGTVHRSVHELGSYATEQYEEVRLAIQQFISAQHSKEIVFTSGATESINLVASAYKKFVGPNDVLLVSPVEHHSNLIPWQLLAKERGAIIKKIPLDQDMRVDLKGLKKILSRRVKLISINHVSNVTGISQDIKALVKEARLFNVPVFVDGAQAAPHVKINVQDLGCDFYCFSGHKMLAPTGTGVLFIRGSFLDSMEPYKTGGQMVSSVGFNDSSWAEPPLKFEAGTPNISGIIGLGEALKFINALEIDSIMEHEKKLETFLGEELEKINGLTLYGGRYRAAPIFSFNVEGVHHYDLATMMSKKNIALRSGHLCNQGIMGLLGIEGCVRASLSFYNNNNEIEAFVRALKHVIKLLRK